MAGHLFYCKQLIYMLKSFKTGGGIFGMAFDVVKKKLGFGCMRLKMTDGKVDYQEYEA